MQAGWKSVARPAAFFESGRATWIPARENGSPCDGFCRLASSAVGGETLLATVDTMPALTTDVAADDTNSAQSGNELLNSRCQERREMTRAPTT